MPVKRCQQDGKPGYKWGDAGKCFTGPNARAQAERQGRAIEARRQRQEAAERENDRPPLIIYTYPDS